MSQPDEDRVVDLMSRAFGEARQIDHGWVGPEHFLLALTAWTSVAQEVLAQFGLTYDRLVEHVRNSGYDPDYPTPHYDPEKGLAGPNPAGHSLNGRAEGIALSSGRSRPKPEDWLLAMIYDTSLSAPLDVLGVSQASLRKELRRRGHPVPSVDPPVNRPWRGHRRVEVNSDELALLIPLLRDRHPPGGKWRGGSTSFWESPGATRSSRRTASTLKRSWSRRAGISSQLTKRTASMPDNSRISPGDFGAAFKSFLETSVSQAPAQEPFFVRRIREHFGEEPATLPIVAQELAQTQHPNLQVAIDAYLAGAERSAEVLGMTNYHAAFGLSLAQVLSPAAGMYGGSALAPGPVEHVDLALEDDRVITCVQAGLFLITDHQEKLLLLVSRSRHEGLGVQAMAASTERAEQLLAELRRLMRAHDVYRGHVLSLSEDRMGSLQISFHHLPQIKREQIILPEGILDRLERHTIGFARHSEKLLSAGRHLKRGLLLHGPPGTGKTLSAMYLAAQMTDRTVLLLKGRGFGLIERSCSMARALEPAMVILEDVDLVAEERTSPSQACTPLLFELLNEMDGLADDADVIFVLTTNRPELLEPALAARPGRIDQAIEVPIPDAECRLRLFELYGAGLNLSVMDMERFIQKTKGVSGAFIRELLRKAALFAADEGGDIAVEDRHLDEALAELVIHGGDLTKSLLGVQAGAEAGLGHK